MIKISHFFQTSFFVQNDPTRFSRQNSQVEFASWMGRDSGWPLWTATELGLRGVSPKPLSLGRDQTDQRGWENLQMDGEK